MIHYTSSRLGAADYGELLARPHFEAVLADLANLYALSPQLLRYRIKRKLKIFKIIKESTTELPENRLKDLANALSSFYFDQKELKDGEREELNLNKILFKIFP